MPYIFDGIFSVDTADIATNTGLKTKGIASIDTSLTGGISYNGIYSSRLNRILTIKVTPSTATVVVTDSDNQEISANEG